MSATNSPNSPNSPNNPNRPIKYDFLLKILIIGDSGAGKSSMMLRYCDNKFSPSFISTIGIDYRNKDVVVVVDSKEYKLRLQCWDTAGQERFRTITTAFFRGAMGVMVVYDVTNAASFNNVVNWMHSIGHSNADVCLVASKCDLRDIRVISEEQGRKLARENGDVPYFEISSKMGFGVNHAFESIAETITRRLVLQNPPKTTSDRFGHAVELELNTLGSNRNNKPSESKRECCKV